MPRLFFALWPDDNVRLRIARHAVEIGRESGGRAVRAEALHVTLSFLGDIEEPRVVDLHDCASRVLARPFNFALDRAACFERVHAAWLGPVAPPQELFELHAALHTELVGAGFVVDGRPFMPHVTVARNIKQPLPVRDIEPILWAARDFCLVESKTEPAAAVYTVLKSWKL